MSFRKNKFTNAVFKSEHDLDFLVAPYPRQLTEDIKWDAFKVGTCEGLFGVTAESYVILAISNTEKGNGHLNDVFQWFSRSCIRDKRSLKILEVWNQDFRDHLINKRGFKDIGGFDVELKYENQ
jgi:hypothetical protein